MIAGTECPPFSQAVKGAQGYADDRARMVQAVVQNIHYLYETQENMSYIVKNVPNSVNFPENIRLLGNEYVILNGLQLGSQSNRPPVFWHNMCSGDRMQREFDMIEYRPMTTLQQLSEAEFLGWTPQKQLSDINFRYNQDGEQRILRQPGTPTL